MATIRERSWNVFLGISDGAINRSRVIPVSASYLVDARSMLAQYADARMHFCPRRDDSRLLSALTTVGVRVPVVPPGVVGQGGRPHVDFAEVNELDAGS